MKSLRDKGSVKGSTRIGAKSVQFPRFSRNASMKHTEELSLITPWIMNIAVITLRSPNWFEIQRPTGIGSETENIL